MLNLRMTRPHRSGCSQQSGVQASHIQAKALLFGLTSSAHPAEIALAHSNILTGAVPEP